MLLPTALSPSKVAPRWERVADFSGTADQRTGGFQIATGAIQWRVTATCTGSRLTVGITSEVEPLAQPVCPGRAFGFAISTGAATLDVKAVGPWELSVDQQLDRPVSEAPMAGMTEASRLAAGSFYGIDQSGSGTATLYSLPDGRRALRLEPFEVTENTDLFVWLSGSVAPRTSEEAFMAPHTEIARLTATAGAQNYLVPDAMPAEAIRSVIIWCEPVRTAYAAASLGHR